MLKFPCLVLDHDDTVVATEESVNYPCFLLVLEKFRPGEYLDRDSFTRWCFDPGFAELLVQHYGFSQEEMDEEFQMWIDYAAKCIPTAFPGIREIILRQKALGGKICVVSHSSHHNIRRDYLAHFGIEPDMIFCWEDPPEQRKPNTYPLEKIMEAYGFTPDQLLMVDDLKPGCDMARKAGVPVAYAGWGRENVPEIGELMRSWCDYAFDDPAELAQFLFDPPV